MAGELTKEGAMGLAQAWYNTPGQGPHAATYAMQPRTAFRNDPTHWSVKFKVEPDTGFIYFRRFSFEERGGQWVVTGWSEDPERPDEEDFDPEGYEDADDFETLEEEERMAHACRESEANEVNDLQAEGELSLEDLMAKYGYPPEAIAALKASRPEAAEPSAKRKHDDTADDDEEARRRKRRKKKLKKRKKRQREEEKAAAAAAAAADAAAAQADGDTQMHGEGEAAPADTPATTATTATTPATATATTAEDQSKTTPAPDPQPAEGTTTPSPHETVPPPASAEADEEDEDDDWAPPPPDKGQAAGLEGRPQFRTTDDYFNPANHPEALEELVQAAPVKKESRVGEQYQAVLPPVDPSEASYSQQFGQLVFRPPAPPLGLSPAFVDSVCCSRQRYDLAKEAALQLLFRLHFDAAAAAEAWKTLPPVDRVPLSDQARGQFEQGLISFGKNFFQIHQQMPGFTTVQLIHYYYSQWKKSPLYDAFVTRCGGFQQSTRTKHLFEPGRDVDDFPRPFTYTYGSSDEDSGDSSGGEDGDYGPVVAMEHTPEPTSPAAAADEPMLSA